MIQQSCCAQQYDSSLFKWIKHCTNQQSSQCPHYFLPSLVGFKWLLVSPKVPDTMAVPEPNIFCSFAPRMNTQQHTLSKIGRMPLLFSCLILLLLMSCGFHPNSGAVFPFSVCAGSVTRSSRSVQCCTCSNWVHFRCTFLP